jgi:hypothetical protein
VLFESLADLRKYTSVSKDQDSMGLLWAMLRGY